MSTLEHTVESFIDMFACGPTSGIVAVSGGADSVALLTALHRVKTVRLVVAHANHQLRGAASEADEAFVRELSVALGCPFESTRLTLSESENMEAAARRERYAWLQEVAVRHHAHWIATGHTRDDQAETVLHRILRGTGLKGLAGIRRVLDGEVKVVRPLLEVSRADVLEHLQIRGQSFRHDASNDDRQFTRNRLRHQVLPALEEICPGSKLHLAQLAKRAIETQTMLTQVVERELPKIERPRAGSTLVFDRTAIQAWVPFLATELLRHVWQREGWPEQPMTQDHWQRLGTLTEGDYPGGIRLVHAPPVVRLGPTASSSSPR